MGVVEYEKVGLPGESNKLCNENHISRLDLKHFSVYDDMEKSDFEFTDFFVLPMGMLRFSFKH